MESKACKELKEAMRHWTGENVIVAFSGGVDSSLLLKLACDAAKDNGTKVCAVTVRTMLHPKKDLETAKSVAEETGAVHRVVEIDELKEAGIEYNPEDRCYRCKKGIFLKIRRLAEELGINCILEGTNADDLKEYRPGLAALEELQIISPLAKYGLTKKEIRKMAEQLGISVAQRPASPCLATRLPYGSPLTYEMLRNIEAGEEYIRGLGFYNVRLRVHGDTVRIEVDEEDISRIASHRESIVEYLKASGFTYITVDLEGFRSGSMDIHVHRRR